MGKLIVDKQNWNAGEISPNLWGRISLDKYANGVETATNCSVLPQGPIVRRNGFKFIEETKDSSKTSRLLPFQFSESDALVLEFGNLYIRFYKNSGQVISDTVITNGTFSTDLTGWSDDDTGTGSSTQTSGVMRLNGGAAGVAARTQILSSVSTAQYTLTFTVATNTCTWRVGTTSGGTEIASGTGSVGANSVTFTPTTNGPIYLQFRNANNNNSDIDNVVLDTPAYEIVSPYTSAQLAGISYAQVGDLIYLAHPDVTPQLITRNGDTSWTIEAIDFSPPPTYESGYKPNATVTPGATTGTGITFTFSAADFIHGDVGRQIINDSGTGIAVITGYTDSTHAVCDIVENFPSTSAIAINSWHLDLSPIGDITPSGSAAGSIITLNGNYVKSSRGTAYAISAITQANPGVVTCATNPLVDGANIEIKNVVGMTQLNGNIYSMNQLSTTTFELKSKTTGVNIDTTNYQAYISSGTVAEVLDDTIIDLFRSTDVGRYILINGGVVKITSYISGNSVKAEVLKSLNSLDRTGDWTLEDPTWTASRGYPNCVALFQDRLAFAGTSEQPQTLWFSETGIYDGFGTGPDKEDSIELALKGKQVNLIKWLAVARDLVAGTDGTENAIGVSSTSGLTPDTVPNISRTYNGSIEQTPIVINNEILFINKSARKIKSFVYDFNTDGYIGQDLNILSDHITESGVTYLAYAQDPNSILYGVRTDGDMLAATYKREEQVLGWCKWETQGNFESIATISVNDFDQTWVIVNRTINGATKRYVELLDYSTGENNTDGFSDCYLTYSNPKAITGITKANPGVVTAVAHGFSNGDAVRIFSVTGMTEVNGFTYYIANKTTDTFQLTDSHGNNINTTSYTTYVSGGNVYKLVTTISGLSHLEGMTVQIKVDGASHPDKTVSSGSITLDSSAYEVTVGLSYTTTIKTLRANFSLSEGNAQGQRMRYINPILRLYKSYPPFVGDTRIASRSTADPMDNKVPLFSGDLEIGPDVWGNTGQLTITQSDPFPLNIQALFGTIESWVK